MHARVYEEFERICRARGAGGRVLEIGAVPSEESLLRLPALRGARERIGVSLDGPSRYLDVEILRENANDLSRFPDARFDTVLSNSVLEHDPRFWRTLAEIRRVTRPGGLIVLGVPGYGPAERSAGLRWMRRVARVPLLGRRLRPKVAARSASVPTLGLHQFPGDYYRFSAQAMREVLLEGCEEVEVRQVLMPPRWIGAGRRAGLAEPPKAQA